MDFSNVEQALKARGYAVAVFTDAAAAADYLDKQIDGETVAMGGSVTLMQMDMPRRLAKHNKLCMPSPIPDVPCEVDAVKAASASIYLTSVNGLAESGEIINIDGIGNRIASMVYGHKKVYMIIGRNKLAPTYEEALWRARNIAAPKNAARLKMNTPCAKGGRCYDCNCADRICRAMTVLWENVFRMEMEIVLIDEELGF